MVNAPHQSNSSQTTNADKHYFSPPPAVSLPKGGGALRGISEKFAATPVTGSASFSVPIFVTPSRQDFYPKISVSYDSAAGNGVFGLGWTLSIPSITRKTDKGLPQYQDAVDSDVFILSEAEDLVPSLIQNGNKWSKESRDEISDGKSYSVQRYHPRIEGLFGRIECWQNLADISDVFWKSVSKDNITSLYGTSANSRIADIDDASHVFRWLLAESYDDRGNRITYHYKEENSDNVDGSLPEEANRLARNSISANRYIQTIQYGNQTPFNNDWLFVIIFDYGEHDFDNPTPNHEVRKWACRQDAFSSFRAGFEIRTYRLCQRVLIFHQFPELGNTPCLVHSTDFTYAQTPLATYLTAATQTGYVRHNLPDDYDKKSLPPLEFAYTQPVIDDTIRYVDPGSMENMPIGLDGAHYQWLDLDSEGLSGILTEQANQWFYKRNLGNWRFTINPDRTAPPETSSAGNSNSVQFAPVELIASKPSLGALQGEQQLMDLVGDGNKYLVQYSQPLSGYYRRISEQGWEPFTSFSSAPNIDWNDPNLKFIDLNGDGHADLLISEHEVFVWHLSLAKEGFSSAERVPKFWDEEKGPALIFADGTQSIYLADMKGDGLTDIVRIRNGEVCYWPNLGYGRFDAKVSMGNAPWFDYSDLFDQKRIRLGDIDGSGTTDVIYLGSDRVSVWFNQSGNSWSPPRVLQSFPKIDDLSSVVVVDLLGNGTACLVWSSPLPEDARQPMCYIDLMSGQKPHLLTSLKNNMGMEQKLEYAASTRFYLEDRLTERQWITKLPFPVHVLTRVRNSDTVTGTELVTLYRYHHGYYDGVEREFRGFGLVEQWDTEFFPESSVAAVLPGSEAFHVPPVYTKTWFHTGAHLDRDNTSQHFQREYYHEPGETDAAFQASLLPDTILPPGLTPQEEQEACRALKGRILRQEIYALDRLTDKSQHPYSVSERNYVTRRLQPVENNRHAVFYVHESETIDYHYERNPVDPCVIHQMTLEVDEFGNTLKSSAIAYPRRRPEFPEQGSIPGQLTKGRALLTYTENEVINKPDKSSWYRLGVPIETRTYEITGLEEVSLPSFAPYTIDFIRAQLTTAVEISYEVIAVPGVLQKRIIERKRTLYRRNGEANITDPQWLPMGEIESLALPCESFTLAFTSGLLTEVYGDKISDPDIATLLRDKARYTFIDGSWWIPSGRQAFDPDQFYLSVKTKDPFGYLYATTYDDYYLLVTKTVDPLLNTVQIKNNYRTMQPEQIMDPNGSCAEVTFDALGMVVGTAIRNIETGPGDSLSNFTADLPLTEIQAFFLEPDPRVLAVQHLGTATTRSIYDLNQVPVCAASIARTTHVNDLGPGEQTKVQINFVYSDGFGREAQRKIQAEPGLAPIRDAQGLLRCDQNLQFTDPRWVGTGRTIYNNKGKPVKQYEPFFSPTHAYEDEKDLVECGVTSIIFYDPLERVVATLHPNHTYEKVVFDPWKQETWDVNDTVTQEDPKNDPHVGGYFKLLSEADYSPMWYTRYKASLATTEQDAATKAAAHANTPTTAHFDVLGRAFRTIARNGLTPSDEYATHITLDMNGNQLVITDARNNPVMIHAIVQRDAQGKPIRDAEGKPIITGRADDLLGHQLYSDSMDAGARWTLNDVAGKPIRSWNSRGHAFSTEYDELRRPIRMFVTGADENDLNREILFERVIYGESPDTGLSTHDVLDANLRTRIYKHYDGAGIVTNVTYDFKGNLLRSTRNLLVNYNRLVDWKLNPVFEDEFFATSNRFDALNRAIQQVAPHSNGTGTKINVIQPIYNEANLLEKLDVWLEQEAESNDLLEAETASLHPVINIHYNAKGQRTLIEYGNRVRTEYHYDPDTFRLTHLLTQRKAAAFPDDCPSTAPQDWPGCEAQNLHYTYDPVGNITQIKDEAQQTIYFRNHRVEPSADYTYDALYRLVNATGREHLGQIGGQHQPPTAPDDLNHFHTGHDQPGDGNAMGTYIEQYIYDAVGNILSMRHHASDPTHPGWKRCYQYALDSNRLLSTGNPNLPYNPDDPCLTDYAAIPFYSESYGYDPHGNMTLMPKLRLMVWNHHDQLQATSRQEVNDGRGETTYYLYDASGQRVRKVTVKPQTQQQLDDMVPPTRIRERIYLGGFEIYREFNGNNANPKLERETLHIMDDKQRIGLIETRTQGSDGSPQQMIRYQFSNHLGSASLELDDQGEVISYEEYYPYGSTSYQGSGIESNSKRYRYSGKEHDEENGLYYYGARYFAPWLGRWISCDPSAKSDSYDLYEFVKSNSIIFRDAIGLAASNPEPPPQSSPEEQGFMQQLGQKSRKWWRIIEVVRKLGKVTGQIDAPEEEKPITHTEDPDPLKEKQGKIEKGKTQGKNQKPKASGTPPPPPDPEESEIKIEVGGKQVTATIPSKPKTNDSPDSSRTGTPLSASPQPDLNPPPKIDQLESESSVPREEERPSSGGQLNETTRADLEKTITIGLVVAVGILVVPETFVIAWLLFE